MTKVGRNDPCPCGSGRKFKKCCLAKVEASAREAAKAADTTAPEAPRSVQPAEPPSTLPLADSWDENDARGDGPLPPEIAAQVNKLWDDFEALKPPTPEQMDSMLSQLLTLPPTATSWGDLLHHFATLHHPDLPGVFRRICAGVPHVKDCEMAFFYWAAAEEFSRRGLSRLLPEVAAGFRKLDGDSYDADALSHIEDFLLAAGFDAEALELVEHFLPIVRADDDLMNYAVPRRCSLIFELRVGRALRTPPTGASSPEMIASELRRGIEEEIHEDSARLAAEIVTGRAPETAWTRAQFELVTNDIFKDDQAWRDCVRLFGTLIRVAQEGWQIENQPPGCVLRGLTLSLNAVYAWRERHPGKRKPGKPNLLDYLQPSGLEQRLVEASPGLIGVNVPRARLLVQAHEVLVRFAGRHQLMAPGDLAQAVKELSRLRSQLDGGE